MIQKTLNIYQGLSPIKGMLARSAIAFGAGAISAYSMPPSSLWFLLFVGLSLFYLLLSEVKTKKACFVISWFYFFGFFTSSLWWIGNALLVEGNEFLFLWPLAVCGLPALLSFFPSSFALLAATLFNLQKLSGFLAFIGFISISEWLRGHLFTGFPWNLFGYSWGNSLYMAQISSFGGIYFLSALTIFWASSIGFVITWPMTFVKKSIFIILVISTMLAVFFFGYFRLKSHSQITYHHDIELKLVQANIKQEDKWDPNKTAINLRQYLALSQDSLKRDKGSLIIIWPETAITQSLIEHPIAQQEIKGMLATHNTEVFLITGLLRSEYSPVDKLDHFNSLAIYNSDFQQISLFNKSHLVPFGEYIPFQNWIPLKPIVDFSGFKQGDGIRTIKHEALPSLSPLICYEIIFPGHVVNKKERPEWIVNITNDAWYGFSPGPFQHFTMAIFRAIEEGIPVVRSANTGISGVIDPLGRVIYKTNLFEQSSAQVNLPHKLFTQTLYGQFGDLIYGVILLGLILISFLLKIKF